MNLKQAVAGVAFAGGIGLAFITGGSGIALAAPGGGGGANLCSVWGDPGRVGPAVPRRHPVARVATKAQAVRVDLAVPEMTADLVAQVTIVLPGNTRGPEGRDFEPRPPDGFNGFRDAPWGGGPAPWGWGAPPRAGWDRPLPPPGGYWN